MYLLDYTIMQTSGETLRGRRRLVSTPKRGTTLLLAELRVRLELVEDLRSQAGKPDFRVHGRELAKPAGASAPRPGRAAGSRDHRRQLKPARSPVSPGGGEAIPPTFRLTGSFGRRDTAWEQGRPRSR